MVSLCHDEPATSGVVERPEEADPQLGVAAALVVAAAQQQGCEWLLSPDLPHNLRIDGVRILNPFLIGPAVLDEPLP